MLDDGRRLEILAAIGVDVYRLRAAVPAASAQDVATPAIGTASSNVSRIAVVCARGVRDAGNGTSPLRPILRALGVDEAAAHWVEISGDRPPGALPDLPAYLMIGATAAHAASQQLTLTRQQHVTIVITPEADAMPRDAAAKRALWQALKPLARRLLA